MSTESFSRRPSEQEAKKGSKNKSNGTTSRPFLTNKKDTAESRAAAGRAFPENSSQQQSSSSEPPKKPDADLIDFFESIEQPRPVTAYIPQQPYGIQQQPQQFQQGGFPPQQTGFSPTNQFQSSPFNGFVQQPQQQQPQQPLQQNFTGAGFGGYTPQPQQQFQPTTLSSIPQDSTVSAFAPQNTSPFGAAQPIQQQTTNPFRQTMMLSNPPNFNSPIVSPVERQSTNPFAKSATNYSPMQQQPFSPQPDHPQSDSHYSAIPAPWPYSRRPPV